MSRQRTAIHHSYLTAKENANSEVVRRLLARIVLHAQLMAW
jgi:hypothetical protein